MVFLELSGSLNATNNIEVRYYIYTKDEGTQMVHRVQIGPSPVHQTQMVQQIKKSFKERGR